MPAPMPYIDSHVHIWTDDYQTYPFAEGIDPADADLPTFHVEDILGHARPTAWTASCWCR